MNKASSFEEMLMWTSYRYCIGRKSYVSCMADEIGFNYYNRLSDERKQHAAFDIRREILDNLRVLPFNLEIHRVYNEDSFDPIGVLMEFMSRENIKSVEDLSKYSRVIYHARDDKFEFNTCTPNIETYFNCSDIDDLLVWDKLASLFDVQNHKKAVLKTGDTVEVFYTWVRDYHKVEGYENMYQASNFGWVKALVPVEEYLKGNKYIYLSEDAIDHLE